MDIVELEFILENKPASTKTVAIKLGKTRKVQHQETLTMPFSNEDVISAIEENGFGAIYQFGKVIFYDQDSRQLRSKNFETTIDNIQNQNELKTMADACLSLVHELRRRAAVDTDVILRRESTIENMMEKFMDLSESYMYEKFAGLKYKEELDRLEGEVNDGYKQKALEAGVTAVNKWISVKGGEIAEEQIIEFILNKPDLLIEALSSSPESIQALMTNEPFLLFIKNQIKSVDVTKA